jgi:hypothetical protein
MRKLRFGLIATVLAIVVAASRLSTAQTANSTEDRGTIGKYEQLISYLSKRGDTNAVAQVNDFITASEIERNATEIGIDVHILNNLRSGKTNEAIRMLEVQLDGALAVFGTPVGSKHDPKYDKLLEQAKEYRGKYQHKSGSPEVDAAIARALDSLPK